MKKSKKLLSKILYVCIAVLIAVVAVNQISYQLKIGDEFYHSAIPNDSVSLGMKSYDVKKALGEPDEEMALMDHYQVGFAGNNYEFRETGEVVLTYDKLVFNESATMQYSYYKPSNKINHMRAYIGSYKTLDEATTMLEKLLDHAVQKFEQKGDYSIQLLDSVLSSLTYRLTVENSANTFMYEIIVNDAAVYGLEREEPYSINIYQSLYSK